MSVFKKKEKASLFQRTIDRLSFKSRKKKDKDKTFTVEVIPQGKNVKPDKASDCEDEMEAGKAIMAAKDARTFMSYLVFGAMPLWQCKCAWISTSYVVGVQSGGNTITEWARFAAPVVTGLMSKGGQQHLRLWSSF